MPRAILAIAASTILPGAGHFVLGRRPLRALVATLAACGLAVVIIVGKYIWLESAFVPAARGAVYVYLVVWAAALADVIDGGLLRTRNRSDRGTADLCLHGMKALIRGDWPGSLIRFDALLRIDPYSAHAHFYRGVVLEHLRRARAAQRAFARCYYHDVSRRWDPLVRDRLRVHSSCRPHSQ